MSADCVADHRTSTICVGGHWRASAPRPAAQVGRPCTPDGTRLGRCRHRRFLTRNTSAPSLTGLRLTLLCAGRGTADERACVARQEDEGGVAEVRGVKSELRTCSTTSSRRSHRRPRSLCRCLESTLLTWI